LARDLGSLAAGMHGELDHQTTEIKRMLTALVHSGPLCSTG